jgi:hypothetical protein
LLASHPRGTHFSFSSILIATGFDLDLSDDHTAFNDRLTFQLMVRVLEAYSLPSNFRLSLTTPSTALPMSVIEMTDTSWAIVTSSAEYLGSDESGRSEDSFWIGFGLSFDQSLPSSFEPGHSKSITGSRSPKRSVLSIKFLVQWRNQRISNSGSWSGRHVILQGIGGKPGEAGFSNPEPIIQTTDLG